MRLKRTQILILTLMLVMALGVGPIARAAESVTPGVHITEISFRDGRKAEGRASVLAHRPAGRTLQIEVAEGSRLAEALDRSARGERVWRMSFEQVSAERFVWKLESVKVSSMPSTGSTGAARYSLAYRTLELASRSGARPRRTAPERLKTDFTIPRPGDEPRSGTVEVLWPGGVRGSRVQVTLRVDNAELAPSRVLGTIRGCSAARGGAQVGPGGWILKTNRYESTTKSLVLIVSGGGDSCRIIVPLPSPVLAHIEGTDVSTGVNRN